MVRREGGRVRWMSEGDRGGQYKGGEGGRRVRGGRGEREGVRQGGVRIRTYRIALTVYFEGLNFRELLFLKFR